MRIVVKYLFFFIVLNCTTRNLLAQQQSNDFILDTITLSRMFTLICDKRHNHPVDIKAKFIVDSLRAQGVDTLLIYRDWFGTNGPNGYGKVLWMDNGILKQYRIDYINRAPYIGIKSITLSTLKVDSIFSFYFNNKFEIENNGIKKQKGIMSHDEEHFVYFYGNGMEFCFNMTGILMRENLEEPRSKLIKKLRIDSRQYKREVYNE